MFLKNVTLDLTVKAILYYYVTKFSCTVYMAFVYFKYRIALQNIIIAG